MQDFRKLKVFDKAHAMVLETYRISEQFPDREKYGLTAQMRSAAASIGYNICEACGRPSDGDFRRLLGIAAGSSSELKYQLLLSKDLGYMHPNDHSRLEVAVDEIMRMLAGLMKMPAHSKRVAAINPLTANS